MNDQPPRRLARHFEVFIEDQVAAGHYDSPTAVLEEALRLLERKEAREAALATALREGIESGEAVDFDMKTWLDEQDRVDSDA
jgi:antitoxin ParD1/3/4